MVHADVSLIYSAEVCADNRSCGCPTTSSCMFHPLSSLFGVLSHGEMKEGLSLGNCVP